jgi:hypothetical protein
MDLRGHFFHFFCIKRSVCAAALLGGHRNSSSYFYSCNATFAMWGALSMSIFCERGVHTCWEGRPFCVWSHASFFHQMGQ